MKQADVVITLPKGQDAFCLWYNTTMKKIIIPVEIYKAAVFVWVGTPEEGLKAYKKTGYYKNQPDFIFQHGAMFYEPGSAPVVWVNSKLPKKEKIAALSHEFMHVIIRMFQNKGVEANYETDEFYAYYMEYLMNAVLKKL